MAARPDSQWASHVDALSYVAAPCAQAVPKAAPLGKGAQASFPVHRCIGAKRKGRLESFRLRLRLVVFFYILIPKVLCRGVSSQLAGACGRWRVGIMVG